VTTASNTIKTLCAAASLVFVYGCGGSTASKSSGTDRATQALNTAQSALSEAKAARTAAEAALAEARAANAKLDQLAVQARGAPLSGDMAQQVLDAARSAQRSAEEARAMALEAQDAAARLDQKTDRMFEKSMRK
jgi:outer membrane murein-binding lipoprotein Lpp